MNHIQLLIEILTALDAMEQGDIAGAVSTFGIAILTVIVRTRLSSGHGLGIIDLSAYDRFFAWYLLFLLASMVFLAFHGVEIPGALLFMAVLNFVTLAIRMWQRS